MENSKLLNPYEKQYMKMAMLKHEQTFKQQVYELHRLYQVQKILMKNMKGNNVNSGLGTFIKRVDHDIDRPLQNSHGGDCIYLMEESEIELTLGPSSCYGDDNLMRIHNNKKKMDGKLNSGKRSLSSSSTGSSNNNNNNNNNDNNIEEKVRQDRLTKHQKQKQPWFQALSLNVI
ncbi:unnamed protein product [Cochlearia groenlandica]